MSVSASFYVEIGFATKLNYLEFANQYPEYSAQIEKCINQHLTLMKQDCRDIVSKFKTEIQRCEAQRKEDARKQKELMELKKREHEQERMKRAVNDYLKKPIDVDLEPSQKRSVSRASYATKTSRTLNDSSDNEVMMFEEVDELNSKIEQMTLAFKEEREEMNAYIVFLESECERMQQECIEWRRDYHELSRKHIELKKQINNEIVGRNFKRARK